MTRHRLLPFALLASLGLAAPAMAQDAAAGATAFQGQCGVCHSADKPAKNKIGPSLLGVGGRKAGTVAGFNYSSAMKAYGQAWGPANLDAFLTAPSKAVPGTNMTFVGIKDAAKRANMIAFLKTRK
jgi:cytochrome c